MLLALTNAPRDYAWGSTTLLAALEGRTPTGVPEAEVWFGDHPGDPADLPDGSTLDAVTGGKLPYLLKLLAAGAPLSIQVHPTIAQAQDGWAREAGLAADDPQRNYRDANHKPELIVALSESFHALSGLRPVPETLRLLAALPVRAGVSALRARLEEAGESLHDVIGWILSGTAQQEVDDVIAAVEEAAVQLPKDSEFAETVSALAGIAKKNQGDPGVAVAVLMNFVVLRRGEGIFLRAGLLHAYVAGLGVEIMAASDNVLRGGLTPKHIDVPELLSVVDARPAAVPVLHPAEGQITSYPVDVPDFELQRVTLSGADTEIAVTGPAMALTTSGDVAVAAVDGAALRVPVGTAAFATADEEILRLSGTGEVFVAQPGH